MVKVSRWLVLFFLPFIVLNGQESDSKSVSITVYNANLGVVKDIRSIDIPSGRSEIKIRNVAQHIDPTSVHIKLDGEVIEQNYQYDLVNFDKILHKYIDKEIQVVTEKDEVISGRLLSNYGGQIVLERKEGGLLMLPNTEDYRFTVGALPEGLITNPTLVWQINSNGSKKQDIELSYQTGGMNWHAEYVAVLNENDTRLDLNSWVSVENNSGASYKNATLKLVAGDVNLVRPQYEFDAMEKREQVMMAGAPSQFAERQFFEYHIYDLSRPTTLANNETKQISLFTAGDIGITKKYLYKGGMNIYGRSADQNKVSVVVEFLNSKNNNLGMPMPKGKVRVYKNDGNSAEFIGEDLIDHTPKDENIKLKIGEAFDIRVEDKMTENRRITDKVHEQTHEIKLKNRKDEDIIVDVERTMGLNWEILSSSIKYEKQDASTILFKVPVKKNSEATLTYKVRYTY